MMFVPHRKHTYEPARSVTGIALHEYGCILICLMYIIIGGTVLGDVTPFKVGENTHLYGFTT
jgi:hypothetical protein